MEEENKKQNQSEDAESVHAQDPVEQIQKKKLDLEEKQEALKAMLAQDEESNRALFENLTEARRRLFALQMRQYNEGSSTVDLGIFIEFAQLTSELEAQHKKISALEDQLRKQGLTSYNNSRQIIELKEKLTAFELEIAFGKKFIATQYFRHYFQLPHAYKISYEDVKLDYEKKLKVKEGLQAEKIRYEEKRKELTKLIQDRRNEYQELTRELERLSG